MWWQSLLIDVRYACRMFGRNPVFAGLAVAALALGIGANTAIFTIVNSVLLKPLPYAEPDRLVMVWSTNTAEHREHETVAPLDFLDYKQATSFSSMQAGYSFLVPSPMTTSSGTEQVVVSVVTPGMFEMLGRSPVLGRPFTDADVKSAVVISHAFWQTRFGGDPAVLGRVLNVQFQPRTIVGVMPADFAFPYRTMLGPSGFTKAYSVDMWLPLEFVRENSRQTGMATLTRDARFLTAVGRLKPGVTVDQANAEVAGIARHLSEAYPDTNRVVGGVVVPVHEQAVGGTRPALLVLLGGVGVVLLDGLRQPGEHDAGAQHRAAEGDGDSRGARRRARAADSADTRRIGSSGARRRAAGARRGPLRYTGTAWPGASRRFPASTRCVLTPR